MISRNWPAPAKLNLFLHIVGRRNDGYHLLQTVFQFLDFCDSLEFKIRDDGRITRSTHTPGVEEDDDLVIRAARALQSHSQCQLGVEIGIKKRIPMQGGLGGGSSDAATTLVALNQLWGLANSVEDLSAIGVKLGADVPVFIAGNAAFAEGVGDKLSPVEPPEQCYLVVRPDCEIATSEIFNASDLTRNTPPITIRDFLAGAGHNDCQPVAEKRYPEVAQVIEWLGKTANPRMTGTGSCVFAAFATEEEAKSVLQRLPERWQGIVCQGLNRSPLCKRLQQDKLDNNKQ